MSVSFQSILTPRKLFYNKFFSYLSFIPYLCKKQRIIQPSNNQQISFNINDSDKVKDSEKEVS